MLMQHKPTWASEPALAAIRDRSDNYTPALLTMIVLMLSALIMMVLYRPQPVEGV